MDQLTIIDLISWFCLAGGGLFVLVGVTGILRFPDIFTRLHAAGVTDTMGAGLILTGLMFQAGLSLITVKIMLILIFLAITGPTASHALAKAALHGGQKPLVDSHDD